MQKANNQFNVLQNRLIHVLICAFRNEAVITVTTNVITVTTNVITATKIYGNDLFR
jgi:hypothetical protein